MGAPFLPIPQDPTADHFRAAANLIAERFRGYDEAYGLGLIAGALIQAYEIGLISRSQIAIPARKSNLLHCSYCGLSQHEVEMLVAGPGMIFICPECAGGVIAAMASWRRDNGQPPGPVMVPTATATEALSLLREFRADWSATATPADIEQAYGSAEAEMCARVDAAISALAPVVAEGGAP